MFQDEKFLSPELFSRISALKTDQPQLIRAEAEQRKKPPANCKQLVLAAADHNARMITGYEDDPIRLGRRRLYLSRLARILLASSVDGVEASPDILEELLLLNYIIRQEHGLDLLSGRRMIGTVNRGGLKDAVWEMDDFCSCFTVRRLTALHLDGAKFMLRINPGRMESKNNLQACVETINQARDQELPVFIECLFVTGAPERGFTVHTDLESLVKAVGVASALGYSAAGKWLELPLTADYLTAVSASTCPVLVVPDESGRTAAEVVAEYAVPSALSPQVRGILLGRNVLFSPNDPAMLAEAIGACWHQGCAPADAYEAACHNTYPDIL